MQGASECDLVSPPTEATGGNLMPVRLGGFKLRLHQSAQSLSLIAHPPSAFSLEGVTHLFLLFFFLATTPLRSHLAESTKACSSTRGFSASHWVSRISTWMAEVTQA